MVGGQRRVGAGEEQLQPLVGQVVAVSLETVKIVRELPALGLEPAQPA